MQWPHAEDREEATPLSMNVVIRMKDVARIETLISEVERRSLCRKWCLRRNMLPIWTQLNCISNLIAHSLPVLFVMNCDVEQPSWSENTSQF